MSKDSSQTLSPTSAESSSLRRHNGERLTRVLSTSIAAVVFDFDGVIRHKGETSEAILRKHAELLARGLFLCPCTARGDSLWDAYLTPMQALIEETGLSFSEANLLSVSRNGAVTEWPYRKEVVDHHPISFELSEAIIRHPLVSALAQMIPEEIKSAWQDLHHRIETKHGIPADERSKQYPGLFLDRHTNGQQYKITMYFDGEALTRAARESESGTYRKAYSDLLNYCSGDLPPDAPTMAQKMKSFLEREGIYVGTGASSSDPFLDITAPNVDKGVGYRAARCVVSRIKGMTDTEVDKHTITLGDSPQGNDAALLACGLGVTNVDYFTRAGPIVIDPDGITDQLERTLYLFSNVIVAE